MPGTTRAVVGMLGGIGAGKSHVARRTVQLAGGSLVDADVLAHEALAQAARDGSLAEAVGAEFVRDGRADVRTLGMRAFEDPALLRRLERLVHPPVHSAIQAAVDDFRAAATPSLLVLDVPLLIEVGLDRRCTVLWFVDAPDDVRTERAGHRGLTLQQIRLREAFQSPRERKRARADRIIRNDVAPEALDAQIVEGLLALGVCQLANDAGGANAVVGSPGGPAVGSPAAG